MNRPFEAGDVSQPDVLLPNEDDAEFDDLDDVNDVDPLPGDDPLVGTAYLQPKATAAAAIRRTSSGIANISRSAVTRF